FPPGLGFEGLRNFPATAKTNETAEIGAHDLYIWKDYEGLSQNFDVFGNRDGIRSALSGCLRALYRLVTGSAIAVRPRALTAGMLIWIGVAIAGGLIGLLFYDVLMDLAAEWWTQSEASYGILIPPFTFYVIYLQRRQIFSRAALPDLRGLSLIG